MVNGGIGKVWSVLICFFGFCLFLERERMWMGCGIVDRWRVCVACDALCGGMWDDGVSFFFFFCVNGWIRSMGGFLVVNNWLLTLFKIGKFLFAYNDRYLYYFDDAQFGSCLISWISNEISLNTSTRLGPRRSKVDSKKNNKKIK